MSTIESLDAPSEKGGTTMFDGSKLHSRGSRMTIGGEDEKDFHSMKLGGKK